MLGIWDFRFLAFQLTLVHFRHLLVIELVVELPPGPLHPLGVAGPVAPGAVLFDDPSEIAHLVEPVGAWVGRQVGRDQREIESAFETERGRSLDHPRVPGEPPGLLVTGSQMDTGGRQPAVDLVETAAGHTAARADARR